MVVRLYPDPQTQAAKRDAMYKKHYREMEERVLSPQEEAAWAQRLEADIESRARAREERLASAVEADTKAAASPKMSQAELDGVVARLQHQIGGSPRGV